MDNEGEGATERISSWVFAVATAACVIALMSFFLPDTVNGSRLAVARKSVLLGFSRMAWRTPFKPPQQPTPTEYVSGDASTKPK